MGMVRSSLVIDTDRALDGIPRNRDAARERRDGHFHVYPRSGLLLRAHWPSGTSGAIASAKLEIDGFEYGTFAAGDGTGDVFPLCEVLPSGVSHTAVLTGMSAEPYVIDGMVAR
jgi:hypothetical protein